MSAHQLDAARLALGDGEITGAHTLVEFESLRFEAAVGGVAAHFAPLGTRQRNAWIEVEEQRELRLNFPTHDSIESANGGLSEAPTVSLIGERGVIETVAHHQLAPGKRRPHDFLQVLSACSVD